MTMRTDGFTVEYYDPAHMTDKQKMELIWEKCGIQDGAKRARWVKNGGRGGYELDMFIRTIRKPLIKTDQFKDFNK